MYIPPEILLIAPILVPFGAAILCLFFWTQEGTQKFITVFASIMSLFFAFVLFQDVWSHGIRVTQAGNWPAPFGITIVADMFSAIMVVLAAIVGICVTLFSLGSMDIPRQRYGYFSLYNVLIMGVNGAFLTGDIFNLYVWFEVTLIASFSLIILGSEKAQLEGAIKYVTLNLLSSVIFLSGVGLLYGHVGSLNMADLALKISLMQEKGMLTVISFLFLVSFGIKSAVFPLFFWLPASYHTPPVAISALFAGLLTKVGVYALFRVFSLLFTYDTDFTHQLLLIISLCTLSAGIFGAIAQNEIRRILSFLIVSHIGYMILGLSLFTITAIAGSIFYIIHDITVKSNLFMLSGVIKKITHSYNLSDSGGIYKQYPFISLMFIVPALSLSGVPPLSGFWGKFILVRESISQDKLWVAAIALITGLLTLYVISRIWSEAFWKKHPGQKEFDFELPFEQVTVTNKMFMYTPIILLFCFTIITGLFANRVFEVALVAAEQLHNPVHYIDAVLNNQTP